MSLLTAAKTQPKDEASLKTWTGSAQKTFHKDPSPSATDLDNDIDAYMAQIKSKKKTLDRDLDEYMAQRTMEVDFWNKLFPVWKFLWKWFPIKFEGSLLLYLRKL